MIDVTGQLKSRRSTDAYVDDGDNWATAPKTQTVQEVLKNLHHHSQLWSNLVAAIGGLMAFHKCNWQLLIWMAVSGYYVMTSRNQFKEEEIELEDHQGTKTKIDYKPHTKPNKGLGFLVCPNADQKPEFVFRLKQAKWCASRLFGVHLTGQMAWLALVTRVIPKVTYCFGLTRFTKQQLHRIAVAIDNVFIPRLGINRHIKRIVVYVPEELGGINFPSIETIQDQKGITLLVRQLQWDEEIATDL